MNIKNLKVGQSVVANPREFYAVDKHGDIMAILPSSKAAWEFVNNTDGAEGVADIFHMRSEKVEEFKKENPQWERK